MKSYESQAKNIDEAIALGLDHLGVSIGDVTIEIINEGAKGLFGLFGSKSASVRLTLKDEAESIVGSKLSVTPPVLDLDKKTIPAIRVQKEKKSNHNKAGVSEQVTTKPETKSIPKRSAPRKKPMPEMTDTPITVSSLDLSSECERAKTFLIQLTKLMGIEITVEIKTDDEGNIRITMVGDGMGVLIGRRGETLDALQYLTSLCVNKSKDGYTRVTLDAEDYRAKREEALSRLANRMASRAVKTGKRVSLEPMNPYERRVIHSALQGNNQVETHSEGEDPNRFVVITLVKS